ncbi:Replication factor C large subunit [Chlorella vulgaris]
MDSALDAGLVAQIREWLARGKGSAWITGHPGSGMTMMMQALVDELQLEAVWMTPSMPRSRAFLRDVCRTPRAVNGRRKVLVLDELDVVLGNESAMVDVAHVVKADWAVPVVCLLKATRGTRDHELARKASLAVHFPPPSPQDMARVARKVASEEGLQDSNIVDLCRRAPPGDIRHVLQTLRFAAPVAHIRDHTVQTADAVAAVFAEASSACSTIEDAATYADYASNADLVDAAIHSRNQWGLMDFYGCLTTASAVIMLPKARVALHKYGVAWNQKYARDTKIKNMKKINQAVVCAGCQPLRYDGMASLRDIMSGLLTDRESFTALCRSLGLGSQDVLKVMRLGKNTDDYKLSVHNRTVKVWLKM